MAAVPLRTPFLEVKSSPMALLEAHLHEIELCSSTISDLPFAPPKVFTNALLRTADITSLIRDTESHERALFSYAPPTDLLPNANASVNSATASTNRRATAFSQPRAETARAPRRNTAVAAVLGGEMAERLRREKAGLSSSRRATAGKRKDEVDVEFLLRGAERLCAVYPIAGAAERIASLRNRHRKVSASLERYEALVAEQNGQLRAMKRPSSRMSEVDDEEEDVKAQAGSAGGDGDVPMTEDDLRREEESVKELEQKKQMLEERVNGMEKDLGGILR